MKCFTRVFFNLVRPQVSIKQKSFQNVVQYYWWMATKVAWNRREHVSCHAAAGALPAATAAPRFSSKDWQLILLGALCASFINFAAQWASKLPAWRRLIQRFIWWKDGFTPPAPPVGMLRQVFVSEAHLIYWRSLQCLWLIRYTGEVLVLEEWIICM